MVYEGVYDLAFCYIRVCIIKHTILIMAAQLFMNSTILTSSYHYYFVSFY